MKTITSRNAVFVLTAAADMVFEVYSMPTTETVYCFNFDIEADANLAFVVTEMTLEEAINEISGRVIDGCANWEFVNGGQDKLGVTADMLEDWQAQCAEEAE